MAPVIETERTDGDPYIRYIFNVTVTNLGKEKNDSLN